MKYIKEYSEYDERGSKWKIPLKEPDFFICLRKVKMSEEIFERWKNLYRHKIFLKDNYSLDKNYIILQQSPTGYFTWSPYELYSTRNDYSYKYKGELKATPEEIQDWNEEQEAKEIAKKYNL